MKLILLLAIIGAAGSAAFGNPIITPAYELDSIAQVSDTPLTLGFWFKTNQSVMVTSLGYFDDGDDGFGVPHQVGMFDPQGTLLFSTTLSAGTIDPLNGHFRYHSITPIELLPDTWYLIAATTGGPTDEWGYGKVNDINGINISPFIFVPSHAAVFVYQSNNQLQFPTQQFGYQFYSGPNMLLDSESVPEPCSLTLMLVVAMAFGLRGFRNIKKRL